tara:strand:+ start:395 stop:1018 length:624 start_codon:yes stop_codon:yes gene_type:complete
LESLLLVFAKTPTLGIVKSRLAETLGEEKTLWVYQQLLAKTEAVLQQTFSKVVVFYAGQSAHDFKSCFKDFPKKPQMGTDLGKRMSNAFEWGFAQGFPKVIGIGTDLWDLDPGIIEGALSALDATKVVLGPAKDGGYYLIGMREFYPKLFENKTWSGPEVFKDTLADLQSERVALLEEKSDIDSYKDLVLHLDLLTRLNQHFDEGKN